MKILALLFAALLSLGFVPNVSAADAPDSGFYVLGGVGRTMNNNDQSNLDNLLRSVGGVGFTSSLSDPTVYKLQIGYQVMKYFAVEGGYLGSSNETYNASGGNLAGPLSASGSIKGWNLNGVGIWPLGNQFSLLGKLGVAGIKESVTVTGPGGSASANGTKNDVTFGIGAKYDFNENIFVRLDLDRYSVGSSSSSSKTNVWMLDLGYKF